MRIGLPLTIAIAVAIFIGMLATFERPPVRFIQNGYRGTGMDLVYNPRTVATELAASHIPPTLPQAGGEGPKAGAVYKNVQVLGDVSVGEFTRLMAAMTVWVAPKQGCGYCHEAGNFASDKLYTKIVARRMVQMVKHINGAWYDHVGAVGVTCYTCHRGQPVPVSIWFEPNPPHALGAVESDTGKNLPAPVAGGSSLPFDPITAFLVSDDQIRVQSTTALPEGDRSSIKQTEWTYALMMHFSQALGVNCVFCHNSRAFEQWSESTPQRVTAWYGIRMVRNLNSDYLLPLANTLPAYRHGPKGDGPKILCATCHQGVYKPLFGAQMAKSFPELLGNAGGAQ